jgi:hypothetical protein
MAYGHAERTLATIRLLEAETRALLNSQDELDAEQAQWLREATRSASRRFDGVGVTARCRTGRAQPQPARQAAANGTPLPPGERPPSGPNAT